LRAAARALAAAACLLVTPCSGQAQNAAATDAPCGACLVPVVRASEAARLIGEHGVAGLTLLFDAGLPDPDTRRALADAGARNWATLDGPAERFDTAGLAGLWIHPPQGGTPDDVIFAIRTTALALRVRDPALRIGLVLDAAARDAAVASAVAPYVDAVRLAGPADGHEREWFSGAEVWGAGGTGDVLAAARVDATDRVLVTGDDPVRLVAQVSALAPLLVQGLTPLADVQVACAGCVVTTWLHPDTLHAIAIVVAADPPAAIRANPAPARVSAVDVDTGRAVAFTPAATELHAGPAGARRLVLDLAGWQGTGEEPFRDRVQVSASRLLTVEEILARHQAWRARQDAYVQTDVSSGSTVLTFDVPGFAGPVTITATTRTFVRGARVEMEQREIRMNGVDMSLDGHAPRLPLIEPERVLTPPLAVVLGPSYGYRLAGRDRVAGRDCYVIEFSPRLTDRASYEGRAWIETTTFALVAMDVVETGLAGAIVSARQRDEYRPVRVGDRDVWLVARSTSDQIYQAAGLRTPVHRGLTVDAHDVNAPDFDARRDEAFRSRAVILRDTPRGFEYLVPAPASAPPGTPVRVPAPGAGKRVVTLAFGVIDDPNITVPLPYAGLSYLDFDLFGRGIQLSGFFGGTYGQAAWTVPGVFRRGWQLTGRVFAIAAQYNDRSFHGGLEEYSENIRQRPAHADATFVVPLAPRVQLRAGYEFDFTSFEASDDTAARFVVPADAAVHGLRVGLDVQRGPWNALAWWNPAYRQGWRPWGSPDREDYHPGSESFQRYGLSVGRAWVLSSSGVARGDLSWMDGHDLDRFSRYTVDGFDNRLHGYPSASLRYDRGAIVRTAVGWSPGPGHLRFDGFGDVAVVRDPGFGEDYRGYPGIGVTAEVPLPFRFLLSLEWGYGFNGRNSDGTTGTQVWRLAGVKVF
jgi:hypothetical protein